MILFYFLEFIQQKCLVLPEDIPYTWLTIMNSMTQMPYDAVKYTSKTNNTTTSSNSTETATSSNSTETTTGI